MRSLKTALTPATTSLLLALAPVSACEHEEPTFDDSLMEVDEVDEVDESPEDDEALADALAEGAMYMQQKAQEQGAERQIRIDLTDPKQYAFVRNRLSAAGLNPLTAPGLLTTLEHDRDMALSGQSYRNGVEQCRAFIRDLEFNASTYHSQVTSSCFNGAEYSFVDHHLYTEDLNEIGFGYVSEWDQAVTSVTASAVPDMTQSVWSDSLTFVTTASGDEMLYIFTPHLNNHTITDVAMSVAGIEGQIDALSAPVSPQAGNIDQHPSNLSGDAENAVLICLERSLTDPACDYLHSPSGACSGNFLCAPDELSTLSIWPETYDNSMLYMPLGLSQITPVNSTYANTASISIAEAHAVLTAPGDSTDPGGICSATFIQATSNANEYYAALGVSAFLPRLTIDVSPFALGIGDGTWGSHCVDHRTGVDLTLVFYIDYTNNFGHNETVSVTASPNNYSTLEIAWGCLPPGTDVTLEDGSAAYIENVRIGDRVISEEGRVLTVTDIMTGTDDDGMVEIEDELGHMVSMTLTHPVPTLDRGVVQARDLTENDWVMSEDGPVAIASIERVEYDGEVYNLKLGTVEELRVISKDATTMFADGILVGDVRMQDAAKLAHDQEVKRSKESTGLPEVFPVDYVLQNSRSILVDLGVFD